MGYRYNDPSCIACVFPCSHINLCLFFFFFYLGWGDTVPVGIANSNVRVVRICYG